MTCRSILMPSSLSPSKRPLTATVLRHYSLAVGPDEKSRAGSPRLSSFCRCFAALVLIFAKDAGDAALEIGEGEVLLETAFLISSIARSHLPRRGWLSSSSGEDCS